MLFPFRFGNFKFKVVKAVSTKRAQKQRRMSLSCILCRDDLDATIKGVMMFTGCPKKGTKDACNHVFCDVCYHEQVLV